MKQIWYPSKSSLRGLFDRIIFRTDHPYLKFSLVVPKEFEHEQGTVIDIESTGLPNHPRAKMITVGFFSGKLVEVYQAFLAYKLDEFQRVVKNLILKRPFPLIAYSAQFEYSFTKYGNPPLASKEKIWKDILQWGVGYNGYEYRKKLIHCVSSPRDDLLGGHVPRLWFDYWKHGNFNSLFEIIYHNVLDVLRESYVAQKIFLEEEYEIIIDNNEPNHYTNYSYRDFL